MRNGRNLCESLFLKGRRHYLKGHMKRAKFYQDLNRVLCSVDLNPCTNIHESIRFEHNGLGVVIHPYTIIGEGCMILQNVTIGANDKTDENGREYNGGVPHIGENCLIYAGAKILGPVKIGGGCIVGANAVVTHDVPPNSLVVGYNIVKPLLGKKYGLGFPKSNV